jgi:hypothetical protein
MQDPIKKKKRKKKPTAKKGWDVVQVIECPPWKGPGPEFKPQYWSPPCPKKRKIVLKRGERE